MPSSPGIVQAMVARLRLVVERDAVKLGAVGATVSRTQLTGTEAEELPPAYICVTVKLYVASLPLLTEKLYADDAHVVVELASPANVTVLPLVQPPEIVMLEAFEWNEIEAGVVIVGVDGGKPTR